MPSYLCVQSEWSTLKLRKMEHQDDCALQRTADLVQDRDPDYDGEKGKRLWEGPCPDRRCCLWYDMKTWFGYRARYFPAEDFQMCFTDIGHGGKGVYERLVVLGTKALELMARVYVSEKYSPTNVPAELQELIPRDILRILWCEKRVERVCSPASLHVFGKRHLSTAQHMTGANAIVRLVRALVGYSIQLQSTGMSPLVEGRRLELAAQGITVQGTGITETVYAWAGTLFNNIYWTQK